ncbi:hypothetical protein FHE74_01405 [Corynebacterium tapiri]|uniref:Copper-containing nitrite reductase n=2 Tax=Corynebacterium tapiri TaxID=1448266 RepID=A0A5C4U7B3_9CORY|nr:hypothetical protein FHE74_01405 [Corynebacterium tapiri]
MAERMKPRPGFTARDASLQFPEGEVHDIEWTITHEQREVAPGHTQEVWLFDGQFPAPTLTGRVGDTFRITLHNQTPMAHSIDFHAGEITPDEAMGQIPAGESHTYEFVAHRAGIWMYHCGTHPMSLHIANGMAGAMVIHPREGLPPVDAEYVLVGHQLFLGPSDTGAREEDVNAGTHQLTAFNGYPNQYDLDPWHAKTGDTVRIWVLNLGPSSDLSFHVVGEIFDTVWSEGHYAIRDAKDTGAQVLPLMPAQGGFVELTFNAPGKYAMVNHVMTDAEKGQHGIIAVD